MQAIIKIQEIQVGERIRKDMGDLEALAESMKEHGLLHPIVTTLDRKLICGHRRIEAARMLGWKEIPFREVSVANLLKAERDENQVRKDLLPSEKVAIGRLIEEQEKPKAKERIRKAASRGGSDGQGSGQKPGLSNSNSKGDSSGTVREIVGKAVGMGGRQYEQAKAVIQAAESEPDKYSDLQQSMDETGNVRGAHEELKRRQGGNGRHPVHRKTHYFKAEKALANAANALEGIAIALDSITPKMIAGLDKQKALDFGSRIRRALRKLSKLGRILKDE